MGPLSLFGNMASTHSFNRHNTMHLHVSSVVSSDLGCGNSDPCFLLQHSTANASKAFRRKSHVGFSRPTRNWRRLQPSSSRSSIHSSTIARYRSYRLTVPGKNIGQLGFGSHALFYGHPHFRCQSLSLARQGACALSHCSRGPRTVLLELPPLVDSAT